MKYGFLVLVLLVGFLSAAMEYYPRPWQNTTWVNENPNAVMFLGDAWFSDPYYGLGEVEKEFLEATLNASIPSFQGSLDMLELEELQSELLGRGKSDPNLAGAIEWKGHASEIALTLEETLLPYGAGSAKQAWDVWNYPGNWKTCAEYSLVSLESYAKEVNAKRAEFEEIKASLVHGGACDDDYTGVSLEFCEMPLEDVSCDSSGTWEDIPDFSWYPDCMHEHWNASEDLGKRVAAINASYAEAVDSCADGKKLAGSKKAEADAVMKTIDDEKIERIYKSTYGKESSRAMGVRGLYASLIETKQIADDAYEQAYYADEKDLGWIKECISGNGIAISGYTVIARSSLLDETDSVVTEYGEDAWGILEKARELKGRMGGMGAERLGTAEKMCVAGDSGVLGDRFENYGKCILYANLATESVTKGEGVIEAYLDAELDWVEGFLAKAKEDNIDTHNEEIQVTVLRETGFGDHQKIIANIEESIIAKATQMYGGLPARRDALKAEIAMGGSGFRFLETWFIGEECYAGKTLDYYCAIGQLKEMSGAYDEVERALDAQKSELVGNSISIDAYEELGVAVLDGKGDAYLYVVVSNPSKFSGENIVFSVNTEYEYRKMDMVQGEERVRIVNPSKSSVEIHLSDIGAGETINIAFKKEEIVCSTKTHTETAYGNDKGGATVTETYSIDCKQAVESLVFNNAMGVETVSVNGLATPVSGDLISRGFAKGTHKIELEYHDYDAYDVEREVGFVSTLAQKTNVELFFNFYPKRDLTHISFSSVEEGKDLKKLEVFGYTGQKISDKNAGGSTIFFKVLELKAGEEAKVRVSYEISDLQEYVLAEIGKYSYMNLTIQELALLNEAKNYALDEENADAYKKLEQLRSTVDSREKTREKVIEKHEKIKEKLREKEADLEGAIALAEILGVENSILNEMRARLSEIKTALATEVPEGVLIGPLEGFDMGWEGKELTKISKELLGQENTLKKEWAGTGAEGQEMQDAILEIEEKNSRFAGTASFSDAIEAFRALLVGEGALEQLLGEKAAMDADGKVLLDASISEAYGVWDDYNREYAEADGTSWKGVFPISANDASKELKKLEARADYAKAIGEADALKEKMEGTVDLLEGEEKRLGENVELLYLELGGSMEEADAAIVKASIETAKQYAGGGQYMLAIKSLESGLKKMQKTEKAQDGIIILAITGLLVLGAVALYLLREKIPADLLKKKKGKEKEYKKLKREI